MPPRPGSVSRNVTRVETLDHGTANHERLVVGSKQKADRIAADIWTAEEFDRPHLGPDARSVGRTT
jgi:hypothetical protein